MNSEQHHEHEAKGYDWDSNYTGEASDYSAPNPLFLELTRDLEVGSALDVGCGAGGLGMALAERGWQVRGVDISPKAINAAKKVAAERGASVAFEAADATKYVPEAQYDLVTSSFALPDSRQQQSAVFRMIDAALAPGGIVLLQDFDSSMGRHEFLQQFHLPRPEELREAFAGYEILQLEVVETPRHEHAPEEGGAPWTAVLLHARKPR